MVLYKLTINCCQSFIAYIVALFADILCVQHDTISGHSELVNIALL
jgi:hypothetical protein